MPVKQHIDILQVGESGREYLSLSFDLSHHSTQFHWLRIYALSGEFGQNLDLSIFKNTSPGTITRGIPVRLKKQPQADRDIIMP